MVLELDSIYHTETMVKILREQGHTQLAMELAETLLKEKGYNENVARILEELKEEARRAFERFKNSGRVGEKGLPGEAGAAQPADEAPPSETSEPSVDWEPVRLTLVADRSDQDLKKIQILEQMLERIQKRRGNEVGKT